MKREELEFVREAAIFFETPSTFTRALSGLGNGIEGAFAKLPETVRSSVMKASRRAIESCLRVAVKTIAPSENRAVDLAEVAEGNRTMRNAHTLAAGITGGLGGILGPVSLALEVPISTALIMRSIASSANDYGFSLQDPEVLLECLFVFAIGGPSKKDDGMESSYLASRLALSSLMRNAAATMMELPAKQFLTALERETAPAVVRVVSAISESFGLRVSEKFVAQLAPVIGAVGGASINVAFANFFGTAAKYHFGIKRLEVVYGSEIVQAAYQDEAKNTAKNGA
ncbi:MAG: EcsC family protein [Bdellovibrionota bacterium]